MLRTTELQLRTFIEGKLKILIRCKLTGERAGRGMGAETFVSIIRSIRNGIYGIRKTKDALPVIYN